MEGEDNAGLMKELRGGKIVFSVRALLSRVLIEESTVLLSTLKLTTLKLLRVVLLCPPRKPCVVLRENYTSMKENKQKSTVHANCLWG